MYIKKNILNWRETASIGHRMYYLNLKIKQSILPLWQNQQQCSTAVQESSTYSVFKRNCKHCTSCQMGHYAEGVTSCEALLLLYLLFQLRLFRALQYPLVPPPHTFRQKVLIASTVAYTSTFI